ncbi:MAG: hypothetical protein AAF378_18190 [Cyanobacteria bacterium P01_A01_bin.84]
MSLVPKDNHIDKALKAQLKLIKPDVEEIKEKFGLKSSDRHALQYSIRAIIKAYYDTLIQKHLGKYTKERERIFEDKKDWEFRVVEDYTYKVRNEYYKILYNHQVQIEEFFEKYKEEIR